VKHVAWLTASLLFLTGGCQSVTGVDAGPPHPGPRPSITHVVVCWLKDPANSAQRQALLDAAVTIRGLPEVADVMAGNRLPTENPLADSSWDVAFVIIFGDEAALNTYEKDPAHLRLKREVLGPNVRQVKVFDLKR
jgi:hypothetical protein